MVKWLLNTIINKCLSFFRRLSIIFSLDELLKLQIEIYRHRRTCKVIALVMSNAGQQQFFEDVCVRAVQEKRNYYFLIVNEDPVEENEKIPFFQGYSFTTAKIYYWLRGFDLALHAEISCRSRGVSNVCYVGHGFPGKHTAWSDANLKSFNHYFLYGPRDRDILEFLTKGHPDRLRHLTFWEVGYPKYDSQINNAYRAETLKVELGMTPGRKTILYAPAWDPGGALRIYGRALLEKFGSMPEYDFVVKLHPASLVSPASHDYEFYTGGRDWRAIMSEICDRFPNVFFYQKHSINPLFKLADVLVTDFSGVALGFFIENKPVVCIDSPEYFETVLPSWGQDGELSKSNELFNNGRHASYMVRTLDEFSDVLRKALFDSVEMSLARKKIAASLLYNPGKGAEHALNAIGKILECSS